MGLTNGLRVLCKRHLKQSAPAVYAGISQALRRARRGRLDARYDWKIGIYEGASLRTLAPQTGSTIALSRHDLTDINAAFVADPFWVRDSGLWHLFFEIMEQRPGKGVIGHATSVDTTGWRYQGVVLADTHHLSYPHVFQDAGRWFMTPECQTSRAVRLYEAEDFPRGWRLRATLLSGDVLSDATPFSHDGRWWMFVETGRHLRSDTLRLFGSPDVAGPWSEHPASPIVRGDPRRARPAGRVVESDGRLIRFAQDCAQEYGVGVEAFEIVEFDTRHYVERSLGRILGPNGDGPFANGMHHIDAVWLNDRWIACVDGR